MMNKNIYREYKQGRKRNIYLRENNGTFFLEKITKACGFAIFCGTEQEVEKYISDNGYSFVGLYIAESRN